MKYQPTRNWTVGRILRWSIVIGLPALLAVLMGDDPRFIYIASLTCVYIIATMGLNLTLGYAGQVSLGHAAFMGIGAYTVALMMRAGHSFWLALPLGALIAFVMGLLLGLPALRVKRQYLALVTLGFGAVVYLFLSNESRITGGFAGLPRIPRPQLFGLSLASDMEFFLLVAGFLVLLTAILLWVLNSRWGRAFKAIRENEMRAEMVGVSQLAYKLLAFAIGGAYAGVAGGLLAPLMRFIDPTSFPVHESFWFLIMLLIGGTGRFEGPFVGVIIVMLMPEFLRGAQQLYGVIFAAVTLLIVLFQPSGIVGLTDPFFRRVLRRNPPQLTK